MLRVLDFISRSRSGFGSGRIIDDSMPRMSPKDEYELHSVKIGEVVEKSDIGVSNQVSKSPISSFCWSVLLLVCFWVFLLHWTLRHLAF